LLGLFKKRWIPFDQAVRTYKPYLTVKYGVTSVSPKDIVALSSSPKKMKTEEKFIELRKSIETRGWKDNSPEELQLYRLPNGKYVVANEGNHLSYLSNEFNLSKIQAFVSILIPEEYIPENIKSQLEHFAKKEYLSKQRDETLLSLAKFLNLLPKEGAD